MLLLTCFLVGAFNNKRARLLQSLVFFKDRLEAMDVNVQLKETKYQGNATKLFQSYSLWFFTF